jgi:transcriptional regulator with XRE-family HTH domain
VNGAENAANLLRALRRQQGRSLRTAAADIGVAPSQLSRLERGQRGLGADVSERIATYYGVPAEVIALAYGDVPRDVIRILQAHPELIERLRDEYGNEDDTEDDNQNGNEVDPDRGHG